MRLVKNWRAIAARAHSMWAFYLSFVALVLPDAIYLAFSIDTNPRLWWLLALALLAYGIWGRLKDQGIEDDPDDKVLDERYMRQPFAVLAVALVIGLALVKGDWRGVVVQSEEMPTLRDTATLPVSDPQFAELAVPFIGRWEGLRLEAYKDIVGVWTVCYGETKGIQPGDRYTLAECDAMLAREVLSYRRGLHEFIDIAAQREHLKPLRDVAFTSLAYNVGVQAAGRSTAIRRLNAGNIDGACEALTWWNKAGQRVVRGLVNRRAEERAMCLGRVA